MPIQLWPSEEIPHAKKRYCMKKKNYDGEEDNGIWDNIWGWTKMWACLTL